MNSIYIIGGGVIGLCSAYFLRKEGLEVTIIDAGNMETGSSTGNAGLITPSHAVPLASPGMFSKGIRWMFSPESPFYIRPRMDVKLVQWLWQFYRAASHERVERATPFMADYQLLSKSLYRELAEREQLNFRFSASGVIMLARKAVTLEEIGILAEKSAAAGMRVDKLTSDEIRQREPSVSESVIGGYLFHDDAQIDPGMFIRSIRCKLEEMGVRFLPDTRVSSIETYANRVNGLITVKGEFLPVEGLLICAGAWSAELCRGMGIRLLLQDGKGYSITFERPQNAPRSPLILEDLALALTPIGDHLRVAGMLELSGLDSRISRKRLDLLRTGILPYFNGVDWNELKGGKVWYGFRPCSADGIPYVGKLPDYQNTWIATGHAMQGMSLGPATGLLIAELISGKKTTMPVKLMDPGRYAS